MSMRLGQDIYGMMKEIIHEETIYLRHYIGKIVDNNDPLGLGRIKICIEELGLYTPDLGIWANSRQGNSMSIPAINQYAEIYFLAGDRTRPVYLFPASEIINNIPKSFTGNIKEHIVFQSPDNIQENIKYNALTELLTIFNGTESFVLGNSFLTWLNNFVTTIFNVHTHTDPVAGITGPPVPTGTSPTNILSQKIKGK